MWETIEAIFDPLSHLEIHSSRLKVPGGWVVRTITAMSESAITVEQTFIVDERHKWELKK